MVSEVGQQRYLASRFLQKEHPLGLASCLIDFFRSSSQMHR